MTDEKEDLNSKKGLSPEDRGVLNSEGWIIRGEDGISDYLDFISTLRTRYREDPLAIEQINIFDPHSAFQEKNDEWIVALRDNDAEKIDELKLWFEENHPLTFESHQKAPEAYL